MLQENLIGTFRGRELLQKRGSVGGSRNVFVKLQGIKNELVYPTFGGIIMNPFKGAGKMFAGDLCWYKTDSEGVRPEIYLLKTFEAVSASGTTINILKGGFRHKPFVGDIIMVAPNVIGGTGTGVTITAVEETTVEVSSTTYDVYAVTVSSNIASSISKGTILVEAAAAGSDKKMLVEQINAVIDCDCDFFETPVIQSGTNVINAVGSMDFDSARYLYAPALGGLMYTHKMSPLPQCVKDLNRSNVNGWFKVNYYDMRAIPDTNYVNEAIAGVQETIAGVQEEINDMKPLESAADPTTSTVGKVTQLYKNTTDNGIFMCVAITGTDEKTYTWEEITFVS